MNEITRTTPYVYTFANGQAAGRASERDLLGGKGANLAEMTNLGIPVPAGFTLSTEVCAHYSDVTEKHGAGAPERFPDGLNGEIDDAIAVVEQAT
ncbi:MAG: PEP/pyruvate-binding domain-containing protein, partial [Planctomycetota bacterium]|nr:PEP/pyruvate-binding domain-containing protein [Planctomycetota bacterium]